MSSSKIVTTVAPESYNTIKIAFPAPISSNEPYDPEYTYATASATHMIKANTIKYKNRLK